jgi:hypothetical protein
MKTITEKVGGGNPPWSGPKTFAAFLTTDAGKKALSHYSEFADRLVRSGDAAKIKTITMLKTFARQRYPDHYGDWRNDTSDKAYGKEAMSRLWAAYLQWVEE